MKKKTTITTNDLKVIAAIIGFIFFAASIESIVDMFADFMCRLIP